MDIQDVNALILVYSIIVISLGISLYCDKKGYNVDVRKIVHIGVGNFALVWWMFSQQWIMLTFFSVPFAVLLFFAMLKDNIVSKSKLGDLSQNKGHRTGLFFYVISINIAIIFFFDHWTAASIGMMAMTYGDGMGSVIGKRFGKHKTFNGKSLEGSIGVFVSTFVMTVVIVTLFGYMISCGFYPTGNVDASVPVWVLGIVAGLVASVAEMFSPGELDNLIMPFTVTVSMILLGL